MMIFKLSGVVVAVIAKMSMSFGTILHSSPSWENVSKNHHPDKKIIQITEHTCYGQLIIKASRFSWLVYNYDHVL